MPIYKDPLALSQSLTEKPGRTPFYYAGKNQKAINEYLKQFSFGDNYYDKERKQAAEFLKKQYGLDDSQISDVLDAAATRITHEKNQKRGNERLRKKVGRFETGRKWEEAQAEAQNLLKQYPNASGIVYGLHYKGEDARGNSGLKKPIVAYDDDLENVARSLAGNEAAGFQIDTLYNN